MTQPIPVEPPPRTVESEAALLSCLLIDGSYMAEVSELVEARDFDVLNNRRIYAAMEAVASAGAKVDAVLVIEELRRAGRLEEVGGEEAIEKLWNSEALAANAMQYARAVAEHSTLRKVRTACQQIMRQIEGAGRDVGATLDIARDLMFGAFAKQTAGSFASIRELVDDYELPKRGEAERGQIPTGLIDLGRIVDIFKPETLTTIAGRPGMGKSSLMRTAVMNASESVECCVFGLEESTDMLRTKLLCMKARVDSSKLERGTYSDEDAEKIALAMGTVRDLKITAYKNFNLTAPGVRMGIRRLDAEGKRPRAVFIDYLGLMQHARAENRVQAVSETTRELKLIAKEFGISVVMLVQMNRGIESREGDGAKPRLSDLRDSGSIEQDSDHVIFVYRSEIAPRGPVMVQNVAVAKNRHGATGTFKVRFQMDTGRFENYYPEAQP